MGCALEPFCGIASVEGLLRVLVQVPHAVRKVPCRHTLAQALGFVCTGQGV